tara:strand:- start:257 stop:415 length:159 start_codon:yes stop_codon:yes gene_type:complete
MDYSNSDKLNYIISKLLSLEKKLNRIKNQIESMKTIDEKIKQYEEDCGKIEP